MPSEVFFINDLLQPWHIVVLLCIAGLFLLPVFFYIQTLIGSLNQCSRGSRSIEPAMMWLLLVSIVNRILHFFVVNGTTRTLATEFKARDLPMTDEMIGGTTGLAMCICGACRIIPLVGFIAWPVDSLMDRLLEKDCDMLAFAGPDVFANRSA
jgi:hypothetical protein